MENYKVPLTYKGEQIGECNIFDNNLQNVEVKITNDKYKNLFKKQNPISARRAGSVDENGKVCDLSHYNEFCII